MALTQSSASTNNAAAATSHTFNYTVTSGTTLLLIVVAGRGTTATPSISSFTYAGSAQTIITGTNVSNGGGNLRQAMYRIENPVAGIRVLVANWSTATNSRISVISYSGGTAKIIQNGVSGTSSTTAMSVTLPRTSLATDFVVDAIGVSNNRVLTLGSNQTSLYTNNAIGSTNILRHSMSYAAVAGKTSMSWTADTSTEWVQSAVIVEEEVSSATYDDSFFLFF